MMMRVLIFLSLLFYVFAEDNKQQRLKEESVHLECIYKGPSFWCKNEATAKKCHTSKYCHKYVWSKSKVSKPDIDTCSYCQNFVDTLHGMIENKSTQTEIVAGLKLFCTLLPDSTKQICTSAMDVYAQTIVDDLVKYTKDAKALCTMINLCSTDSKRVFLSEDMVMMKRVITKKFYGDYCLPCKEYFTGIHTLSSSRKTRSDLVGALKKMCQFLPSSLSTWCPGMVDSYGEGIIDSLFQFTMDPSRPCAAVGLCKSRDHKTLVLPIPEDIMVESIAEKNYVKFTPENVESVSTDVCTYCQQILGTVHLLLMNKETQQQVIAGLDVICDQIPSPGKTICKDVVQIYGQTIIDDLLAYTKDPRNFCQAVHLCSADSERVLPKTFFWLQRVIDEKISVDQCSPCKQHIKHIHVLTSSASMKSDLINGMEGACQFMPKAIQSWCVGFVKAKGEQVVDAFIEYIKDPNVFCTSVTLCKKSHVLPLVAVKKAHQKLHNLKSGQICTYCQQIVGTVRMLLTNNKTAEEVISGLMMACNSIPGAGKFICDELVTVYGKTIIQDVLEYTKDPRILCRFIHLCSSTQEMVKPAQSSEPSHGITCFICRVGAKCLQEYLKGNNTRQAVLDYIEDFCSDVPLMFFPDCMEYVMKNEPIFYQSVIDSLNPDIACHNVCATSMVLLKSTLKSEVVLKKAVKEPNGVTCDFCKYSMGYLQKMLENNRTEAKIKETLHSLCHHMPHFFQASCDRMVLKYEAQLLHLLIDDIDPDIVCNELELCDTEGKDVFSPKIGVSCTMCEFGVKLAYQSLADKATQGKMKFALLLLCTKLPSKQVQTECSSIITQYFDEIINVVTAELKNAKLVCDALHCVKSTEKAFYFPKGMICDTCVQGIAYADQLLESNRTKEIFMCALKHVCKMTPFPEQCQQMAKKYAKLVFSFLHNEFKDPKKTCQRFHMCGSNGKAPTLIKDGPFCEVCEIGVQYLQSYLNNNETKSMAKGYLLQICKMIPIPGVIQECVTLVNQDFDMIYGFILQQFQNPQYLCQELQLCSDKRPLTKIPKVSVTAGPVCSACEFAVGFVSTYLNKNETEEHILKNALHMCSTIPISTLADECTLLVKQNFDQIYQFLLKQWGNPELICEEIKLCPTSAKSLKSQKSGPICEACEIGIGYLNSYLSKPETKSTIKHALDLLCSELPGQFGSECHTYLNQYFDLVYSLVLSQIANPESTCQMIGVCAKSTYKTTLLQKPIKDGPICEACEMGMQYVAAYLKNPSTKGQVKSVLIQVCHMLPIPSIVSECDTLVNQDFDAIYAVIVQQFQDPKMLCQELDLCSAKGIKVKKISLPNSGVTCEICEYFIAKILDNLKGKKTEKEIENELESLCEKLPYWKSQCDHIVEKYSKDIIEMIISEADKHTICKKLKFCDSTEKVTEVEKKSLPENVVTCEICEYFVNKLIAQLKGKETEKEIEDELESLCEKLPYWKTQCEHVVEKYSKDIIKIIVSETDPKIVCQKLHFCDAAKALSSSILKPRLYGEGDDFATCGLCMFMTGKLDAHMKNMKSKKTMKNTLKTICSRTNLAKSDMEACSRMMDEYKDTIIKLAKKSQTHSFCQKSGQCMSQSRLSSIVPSLRSKKTGMKCVACEYVIGVLDTYVSSKGSKQKVIDEILDLCHRLPRPIFINECDALITQYGEDIIELFVDQVLAPVDICKTFHLCG